MSARALLHRLRAALRRFERGLALLPTPDRSTLREPELLALQWRYIRRLDRQS